MKVDEFINIVGKVGSSKESIKKDSEFSSFLREFNKVLSKAMMKDIAKDEDIKVVFDEHKQAIERVFLALEDLKKERSDETISKFTQEIEKSLKVDSISNKLMAGRPTSDYDMMNENMRATQFIRNHMDEINRFKTNYTAASTNSLQPLRNAVNKAVVDSNTEGTYPLIASQVSKIGERLQETPTAVVLRKNVERIDEILKNLPDSSKVKTNLQTQRSLIETHNDNVNYRAFGSNAPVKGSLDLIAEASRAIIDDTGAKKSKFKLSEVSDVSDAEIITGGVKDNDSVIADSSKYLKDLNYPLQEDIMMIRTYVKEILDVIKGDGKASKVNDTSTSPHTASNTVISESGPGISSMFRNGRVFSNAMKSIPGLLKKSPKLLMRSWPLLAAMGVYEVANAATGGAVDRKVGEGWKSIYDPNDRDASVEKADKFLSGIDERMKNDPSFRKSLMSSYGISEKDLKETIPVGDYSPEMSAILRRVPESDINSRIKSINDGKSWLQDKYQYLSDGWSKDDFYTNVGTLTPSQMGDYKLAVTDLIGEELSKKATVSESAKLKAEDMTKLTGVDFMNNSDELIQAGGTTLDLGLLKALIKQRESSFYTNPEADKAQAFDGNNFYGRYQIGFSAMHDLGLISSERLSELNSLTKEGKTSFFKTTPDFFDGKKAREFGLTDYNSFVNNGEAQERIGDEYLRKNIDVLSRSKIDYNGKDISLFQAAQMLGVSPAQLAYVSGFGVGNLNEVIQTKLDLETNNTSRYSKEENEAFLKGDVFRKVKRNGRTITLQAKDGEAGSSKGTFIWDAMTKGNVEALAYSAPFLPSNEVIPEEDSIKEILRAMPSKFNKIDDSYIGSAPGELFYNGKWVAQPKNEKFIQGDFINTNLGYDEAQHLGYSVQTDEKGNPLGIVVDEKGNPSIVGDPGSRLVTFGTAEYQDILKKRLSKSDYLPVSDEDDESTVKSKAIVNSAIDAVRQSPDKYSVLEVAEGVGNFYNQGKGESLGTARVMTGDDMTLNIKTESKPFTLNPSEIDFGKGEKESLDLTFGTASKSEGMQVIKGEGKGKGISEYKESTAVWVNDLRGEVALDNEGKVVTDGEGKPIFKRDLDPSLVKRDFLRRPIVRKKDWEDLSSAVEAANAYGEAELKSILNEDPMMKKFTQVEPAKPKLEELKVKEIKTEVKKEKENQSNYTNSSTVITNFYSANSNTIDDIGNIGTR